MGVTPLVNCNVQAAAHVTMIVLVGNCIASRLFCIANSSRLRSRDPGVLAHYFYGKLAPGYLVSDSCSALWCLPKVRHRSCTIITCHLTHNGSLACRYRRF